MVQVAPVSSSAMVATWLMVTGISQPRWWPFTTGIGVICWSHCTSDARMSASTVWVPACGRIWLVSVINSSRLRALCFLIYILLIYILLMYILFSLC